MWRRCAISRLAFDLSGRSLRLDARQTTYLSPWPSGEQPFSAYDRSRPANAETGRLLLAAGACARCESSCESRCSGGPFLPPCLFSRLWPKASGLMKRFEPCSPTMTRHHPLQPVQRMVISQSCVEGKGVQSYTSALHSSMCAGLQGIQVPDSSKSPLPRTASLG